MSECEREGCETAVTSPSHREKRFCSGKCRAKASRTRNDGKPMTRKDGATIPADVFLARIEPLLGKVGEDRYTRLATACNLKADSLLKALSRDHIDFDLCDLILCRLNAVHAWWTEPLDAFYWNAKLA